MKICSNCSKQLNDDMLFCSVCGQKLEGEGQENQKKYESHSQQATNQSGGNQQNWQTNQSQNAQQPATFINHVNFNLNTIMPTKGNSILSVNPIINRVKLAGSGITYFVFLISYSIMAISGLIHAFTATFPLLSLINSFAKEIPFGSYVVKTFLKSASWINAPYKAILFIQMIPVILIVIGVWMFYMKCKNTDDRVLAVSGLGFIKIPLFVLCGLSCFMGIIFLLGTVGFLITDDLKIGALACVVLLIPQMVMAIYYLMIIRVIINVNTAITSGNNFKITNALVVFNYVIAAFSLLFGGYGIFGNIVGACSIVAITLCITAYNKSVDLQSVGGGTECFVANVER